MVNRGRIKKGKGKCGVKDEVNAIWRTRGRTRGEEREGKNERGRTREVGGGEERVVECTILFINKNR
jgi:hypothetical protein